MILLLNLFVNADRMRLTAWVVKRAIYTVPVQIMRCRSANHRRNTVNQLLIGRRHFSNKHKTWNDQSRIYLQALGVDIEKIDKTHRSGVSWSIEQIKPRIMILLQAGLDKNTVSQIITHLNLRCCKYWL